MDHLLEQVFPDVTCYDFNFLEVFLSEDSESAERRQTFEVEVQESVKRRGLHLFPVHCPQQSEHLDGHWTLLSLQQKADGSPLKVRYFETLDEANEVCLSRTKNCSAALEWRRLLSVATPSGSQVMTVSGGCSTTLRMRLGCGMARAWGLA